MNVISLLLVKVITELVPIRDFLMTNLLVVSLLDIVIRFNYYLFSLVIYIILARSYLVCKTLIKIGKYKQKGKTF